MPIPLEAGDLEVRPYRRGSWAFVDLEGDLDLSTSSVLTDCVADLLAAGQNKIALNLSRLHFADSSGLAVFIESHKLIRDRGGRFALVSPTPIVEKVLEISGLVEVFEIHESMKTFPTFLKRNPTAMGRGLPSECWVG